MEALNKKLQSFLKIFEKNPNKTYEEQIRLLEMELQSFEEIEGIEIDDNVIGILIEQIDNVLKMDVSQAREIIKEIFEEVRIEKDKDLEGFYGIEYIFKNPFRTYNRKINMVAGAGFEPATSGL